MSSARKVQSGWTARHASITFASASSGVEGLNLVVG
jgi:hypothetical protein